MIWLPTLHMLPMKPFYLVKVHKFYTRLSPLRPRFNLHDRQRHVKGMISSVDLRVFSGWSGYTGFLPHTKKLWPFCTSNLLIHVIIRFEMKAFRKSVWDHHKEHLACSGLSLCMGVLKSVVSSIVFKWNPSFKHLNEIA